MIYALFAVLCLNFLLLAYIVGESFRVIVKNTNTYNFKIKRQFMIPATYNVKLLLPFIIISIITRIVAIASYDYTSSDWVDISGELWWLYMLVLFGIVFCVAKHPFKATMSKRTFKWFQFLNTGWVFIICLMSIDQIDILKHIYHQF